MNMPSYIPPYVSWTFIREKFEIKAVEQSDGWWAVVARNPDIGQTHKWQGRIGSHISFRGVVDYHAVPIKVYPGGNTLWRWNNEWVIAMYERGRTERPIRKADLFEYIDDEIAAFKQRLDKILDKY